ncbi:phosphoribosylaminoimidazolesuccinocarboxamide synthase [Marinilactibacillus psychrotolerans]|uniref:Phosphoribosylaminoimidazole-succinocarboxamide synthase n=1 Tax=Marinilactibacillus psychrotolerans 42ea TaxID=1255609 RepID=A0A1R4JHP7_9LACT|nr:phosphoribosylaminoimidazolesuccinocarboxamide synthase [Marinilactibacillus psychrotolerans]SJN31512.1 Phosphoribosylaminoimidazole-succinocarboxamide synthase [Marinilactibacillus psychrotolerans 42ea]
MDMKELLYEGKAKELYETDDPDTLWVKYKNQATAGNGAKKETIEGKGKLNNQITSLLFEKLKEKGIPSHFIKQLSETEQLIQKVEMFPLEVVVRNVAAGSFSRRLGVEEGKELSFPVLEFYLKKDELNDPIINEDHVKELALAAEEEVVKIKNQALEINQVLLKLFKEMNIRLVDFKLEFGKTNDGSVVLADEISPDTCRLWDLDTNDRLDKDVFRKDLGDIIPLYQEVLTRLNQL